MRLQPEPSHTRTTLRFILFDIKAAFPSFSHDFILNVVTHFFGVSSGIFRIVKAMHRHAATRISVLGRRGPVFPITAGIRQGCPASVSLFIICFEPILRMINAIAPHISTYGFADDIAIILDFVFRHLPALLALFTRFECAAGLPINSKKSFFIPLWPSPRPFQIKSKIEAIVPPWSGMQVVTAATYLGVSIGPDAPPVLWDAALKKYVERSRMIGHLHRGWGLTATLFNMLVTSTLSYVWQFVPLPRKFTNFEKSAVDRAFHLPGGSVPPIMLKSTQLLKGGRSLACASRSSRAARLRTYFKLPDRSAMEDITLRALQSDYASMDPTRKHWLDNSIFNSLKKEFDEYTKSFGIVPAGTPPQKLQRLFFDNFPFNPLPEIQGIISHKLKLYRVEKTDAELRTLAAASIQLVQLALSQLPLWAASPVIRLMFGGWPFSARFGKHDAPCRFCQSAKGDSVQHFAECPVVKRWARWVFAPAPPPPASVLGLLGLGSAAPPTSDDRTRHLVFILFLWEAWTAAKHAPRARVFPKDCRQRLRHCGIRDSRIANLEVPVANSDPFPGDAQDD